MYTFVEVSSEEDMPLLARATKTTSSYDSSAECYGFSTFVADLEAVQKEHGKIAVTDRLFPQVIANLTNNVVILEINSVQYAKHPNVLILRSPVPARAKVLKDATNSLFLQRHLLQISPEGYIGLTQEVGSAIKSKDEWIDYLYAKMRQDLIRCKVISDRFTIDDVKTYYPLK